MYYKTGKRHCVTVKLLGHVMSSRVHALKVVVDNVCIVKWFLDDNEEGDATEEMDNVCVFPWLSDDDEDADATEEMDNVCVFPLVIR